MGMFGQEYPFVSQLIMLVHACDGHWNSCGDGVPTIKPRFMVRGPINQGFIPGFVPGVYNSG